MSDDNVIDFKRFHLPADAPADVLLRTLWGLNNSMLKLDAAILEFHHRIREQQTALHKIQAVRHELGQQIETVKARLQSVSIDTQAPHKRVD
jgi:hypothetical protein